MDQQTPCVRPGFRLPGISAIFFTLLTLNLPPSTLGTYYVSLPRSFSPGNPLDLLVQVTNATVPVNVEATIVDGNKTVVSRSIKTIISGKPERIRIDVPDELPKSRYVIAVTGTGGLTFHDEAHLHYEQDVLVLIQTDKTRYSAGQTVLYRAIFLQSDLTNFRGNASISIYDGKNNHIKLDGPHKISHGVIEGQLDLSTEPVYGEWNIHVNVLGLVKSKSFKVFDYILPRFSVELVVPNEILSSDGTISVVVKSRFTFNTDVHGTCTLVVYQENDQYHYYNISKPIQGSVNFTISMRDLRGKGILSNELKVRATVTDNSTLVSFATEKDVIIHHPFVNRYELREIIQRHGFVNGLNYTTYLKLTNNGIAPKITGTLDYTVTYYRPVLRTCQQIFNQYEYLDISEASFNKQTIFGQNGVAEITFPVIGADIEKIDLKVQYSFAAEFSTTLYSMSKTPIDMLKLTLSSAELQVGNVVTVTAESSKPLTGPVILEVFCRNRIVQFDSPMAAGQTTIHMTVSLTEDMVPFSYIVVSHITSDRRILSDSAYVQVDGTLIKNKVQVTYNSIHMAPGQVVDMNIRANPYSTVYVMVGDERNRLLGNENDIFSDEVINGVTSFAHNPVENGDIYNQEETKPGNTYYGSQVFGPSISQTTGLIILTDGSVFNRIHAEGLLILGSHPISCQRTPYPTTDDPYPSFGPYPSFAHSYMPLTSPFPYSPVDALQLGQLVREKFPETWIWEKYDIGVSGELHVTKQLPDSITSWNTSVFATNDVTGFGIADDISQVTVKKPFFIAMDLPDSIGQGEECLLQITVFNYLPTRQEVFISVQRSDDPLQPLPTATAVQSGEGHSTFVKLTPNIIGDLIITVRAKAGDVFTTVAVDTLQKTLHVRPNGVHKTKNKQHLIHLHQTSPTFNTSISLAIPQNMVPGAGRSMHLKITGDFMVPSIDGLQNLINQPSGCGEQNMINFAPDVYVSKYLKTVNKFTTAIETLVRGHLEYGYQNELTNKHSDGSFSAFGDRDSSGSSWLTAFVLKCFGLARSMIMIDDNVMKGGINWLFNQQNADGSFNEPGHVIHTNMQSGTGQGAALTSFILISLLENRDSYPAAQSRVNTSTSKSMAYLETQLSTIRDAYTLAITCYGLALARSSKRSVCFTKLQTAAVVDGESSHWTSGSRVKRSGVLQPRAPAQDIESTAYALLAYIEMNKMTEAFSIVKWLVSQRNPTGGFQSTQDTVVSLQALAKFSELTTMGPQNTPNYNVHIDGSGTGFIHQYDVTPTNYDVTHTVQIPENLDSLTLAATGHGVAVVDVTMSYYVQGSTSSNVIHVTAPVSNESINSVTIDPCVQWSGPTTSGMILVEIEMITGFKHNVDVLGRQPQIKRYEANGRNLALYFDALDSGGKVCMRVTMERADPVVKSQACHVVAYDYYEPTHQAVTMYESGILKNSTVCHICQRCPFCIGSHESVVVG